MDILSYRSWNILLYALNGSNPNEINLSIKIYSVSTVPGLSPKKTPSQAALYRIEAYSQPSRESFQIERELFS